MPAASYEAVATEDVDDLVPSSSTFGGMSRRRSSTVAKILGFKGEASWFSSVVNLLNTIVGAGCLAMPAAMSAFGIIGGIFVIAFSALASGFGLYLQSRCARYIERGHASFFSLSQLTYPNAAVVFDAAIAIKCFGVGVSYLIIIGDLMPQVVEGFVSNVDELPIFLLDRHFWITVFMLIIIPLSFLRKLDSLKYTSFVALTSIGYLMVLVLAHFLIGDTWEQRGPVRVATWAGAVPALSAFPIIVFAYTCHQNMFSILNEIEDSSHRSTTSVIRGSIGTACAIYLLVAITGYLSFGDNVSGNIIAMYQSSWTSTLGRAAIVVLVMFSFPLQCHPCRASINNVLRWRPASRLMSGVAGSPASFSTGKPGSPPKPVMSDVRFAIISSVIIILSYFVAMTVTSLERVLAYVGSTGSTSISFILPGIFYYKISDPDSPHSILKNEDEVAGDVHWDVRRESKGLLRKASAALVVYGFAVMGICLVVNTVYAVRD